MLYKNRTDILWVQHWSTVYKCYQIHAAFLKIELNKKINKCLSLQYVIHHDFPICNIVDIFPLCLKLIICINSFNNFPVKDPIKAESLLCILHRKLKIQKMKI